MSTHATVRAAAHAAAGVALALLLAGAAEADAPDEHVHVHGDANVHVHVHDRPDSLPPIGVMGGHVHERGEWMVSYRYMQMEMRGPYSGTSSEGAVDTFARGFPVSPTWMRMEMHMVGAMFTPTDDLTLMGMLPLVRNEMDHVTLPGGRFTTKSDGIADIGVGAQYRLGRWGEAKELLLNAGLSVPTGTITARDTVPAGRIRLPYPMQLGSGTWDLKPGLTLSSRSGDWGYGAQSIATVRVGRNRYDYRHGHRVDATVWLSRRILPQLSASLRLAGAKWGNIRGEDDDIPLAAPTGDPHRRGGSRVDLLVGANWLFDRWIPGHRLGVEYGRPVYQYLDGPQLETRWIITVGWQKVF